MVALESEVHPDVFLEVVVVELKGELLLDPALADPARVFYDGFADVFSVELAQMAAVDLVVEGDLSIVSGFGIVVENEESF